MRTVFANVGFIMQMSALFTLFPAVAAFIKQESAAATVLLLTATVFFAVGFLFNVLCERKELGFKESNILLVLVFVGLSILGSIPYLLYFEGSFTTRLTNSIFESASGFATAGFSLFTDPSALPRSIVLYRSLTQLIGGIGIVLLLLVFFYPEEKLKDLSRSMGLDGNGRIKRTFIILLVAYMAFSLVLIAISLLAGYRDFIDAASFIFSAIGTGGFSPITDMTPAVTNSPLRYTLIIGMIVGASNFLILVGLLKLRIRDFLRSEIPPLLLLLSGWTILIHLAFKIGWYDSLFHVVSAGSTAGFGYIPLNHVPESLLLILSIIMLIGGTSLSTAGGIKILRIVLTLKAIKKAVVESITNSEFSVVAFRRKFSNTDLLVALLSSMSLIIIPILAAVIFTFYGFAFVPSLFETVSAITGTGLTSGVVTLALNAELKWLIIAIMLLGRVEIFSIFIMLSHSKERKSAPFDPNAP